VNVNSHYKGIVTKSNHVHFKTKNDKRRTRLYDPKIPILLIAADQGRGIEHQVLKVTLRSGEEFAVDIAGAQYGYDECVFGWKEHTQLRVLKIWRTDPPPQHDALVQVEDYSTQNIMSWVRKQGTVTNIPKKVSASFLQAVNVNMLMWQNEENISLKALWKFREHEFLIRRADLVDYIEWLFHANAIDDCPWFTVNGKRLLQAKGEYRFRKWQTLRGKLDVS
jgi:hypothetical protein